MEELEFKPRFLMFKSWLWAFATVSSRTLHIAWDDAGCLCPVGDLFNYAAPDDDVSSEEEDTAEVVKFQQKNETLDEAKADCSSHRLTDGGFEDANAYCFYARKNYRKGEQVLLCYGTYTNLELLQHYGFLLSENPNEKTFIQLDLDIYTTSTWPKDSLFVQPNGHPSYALLCALRLWTTPANRRKAVSHQVYSGSLLSIENELEVMKWLVKKCEETLQGMPTTVEVDESLLICVHKLRNNICCRLDVDHSCFEQELTMFFRSHAVKLDQTAHNQLPVRLQRSMERWELAIQWRCSYKRTLTKCISYCKNRAYELYLQQDQH